MIDDEEYHGLPRDPELAFIKLEKLYARKLEEGMARLGPDDAGTHLYIAYMTHVIAAANALQLGRIGRWSLPSSQSDIYEVYSAFSTDVAGYTVEIKIRHGRHVRDHTVALSGTEKKKIHHHLAQIRKLVDESNLLTSKKDAIYEKISALDLEIDRDRTRFEIFADFASGLAGVSRNFAQEGAEPWWKWVEPIFEILRSSKDKEEDQQKLPPPAEQKKIEPPRDRGPAKGDIKDIDDDIPF